MTIEKFGAAKAQDIGLLEREYGLTLPKDYTSFLLAYNGGVIAKVEHSGVFISDINAYVHIDVLFGVGTGCKNSEIDHWTNEYKDEMPEKALIIGDCIEHGFIVLICNEIDFGICYWDHSYVFPNSNDETNTYYITDTFTGFIESLL